VVMVGILKSIASLAVGVANHLKNADTGDEIVDGPFDRELRLMTARGR
jgi:hypothetical protein